MRKTIKICVFLAVLALTVSLFAVFASAQSCTGEPKNIAGEADVIGDKGPGSTLGDVFWGVFDHYRNAVDGNPETVCPIDIVNWADYGLWLTFDEEYSFSKLVIQTHGIGRAETSQVTSNVIFYRHGEFELSVTMYNARGAQVYYTTATASAENIVIDIEAEIGYVNQIYIFFPMNDAAQGIWEVEAYTNDNHDWKQTDIIEEATCTEAGISRLKCDCGEEKKALIPATGHKDICTGTCGNGCGTAIEVKHETANCASTVCTKCGKDDLTPSTHTASIDPCDTTCTVCKVENTITPKHVASADPCSNDCARCGAAGVIPNKGDAGEWWATGTVLPSSYAPHVQNPNDPCDSKCYKCQKEGVVVAPHVADPADPCHAKDCFKCGKTGVFAANRIGGDDDYAHQRITEPMEIDGEIRYSCSRWCASCKSDHKLPFAHEFDNCGDAVCNVCNKNSCPINERDHTFDPKKPTECLNCDYQTASWDVGAVCVEHVYENPTCSTACMICGARRWGWRGPVDEEWHVIDNPCDTECNYCKKDSNAPHNFPSAACSTVCMSCSYVRTNDEAHTYSDFVDVNDRPLVGSSVCDTTCDVCNEKREVPHKFPYACAPVCFICFQGNPNRAHTYTNDCDKTCNTEGCTYKRSVNSHVFTNACDTDCNTEGCDFIRTVGPHVYDNDCDADCNECKAVRAVDGHKYKNACDARCDICGAIRDVSDHVYDNSCDTDCNVCSATREITHTYDNACDTDCNVCSVTRVTAHVFGEWATTKEAEVGVEGEKSRSCSVCSVSETEKIPALADEGLSTGAIVAISATSVVAVAGGGFSIWWFILRKKFLG